MTMRLPLDQRPLGDQINAEQMAGGLRLFADGFGDGPDDFQRGGERDNFHVVQLVGGDHFRQTSVEQGIRAEAVPDVGSGLQMQVAAQLGGGALPEADVNLVGGPTKEIGRGVEDSSFERFDKQLAGDDSLNALFNP